MSRASSFEEIPATSPRPPRGPEPRVPAAVRRRQLRRARRSMTDFVVVNPQQARLQGVGLAMLAYMEEHWCGPGRAYDFERWLCIVAYYARALRAPELAGNKWQACAYLRRVLDQNQIKPSKL